VADRSRDPELERIKRISRLLDGYFVDPLLGLFLPGLGDVVGWGLGLYAVSLAIRRKMSGVIIARMLLNLSLDAAVGALPLVGDAADFVFKANDRNVALLEEAQARQGRAGWKDWAAIVGALAIFLATIFVVVFAMVRLFDWLFSL
jgi:hypothetical protein